MVSLLGMSRWRIYHAFRNMEPPTFNIFKFFCFLFFQNWYLKIIWIYICTYIQLIRIIIIVHMYVMLKKNTNLISILSLFIIGKNKPFHSVICLKYSKSTQWVVCSPVCLFSNHCLTPKRTILVYIMKRISLF